ncbi:MAG: hypothetical protein ACK4TA_07720 [Saprospiraceae bacterium]
MRYLKYGLIAVLMLGLLTNAEATINPRFKKVKGKNPVGANNQVTFRENCANSVSQIDQAVNNVRARLLTGGDVWWDGNEGRYVVPKVPAGEPEVSSIFAGAVWLGGVDPAGNLKLAAKTFGTANGESDFFSGPLDPETGKTTQQACARWDKFFVVKGENIRQHIRNFQQAKLNNKPYDVNDIPRDVKGWPGRGNPFFFDIHQFDLPDTRQGLAGFWDEDGDGDYNPQQGDFPIVEIRGCNFATPEEQPIPDEMVFWIYNDAGNIHSESQGDPIQMEVQVQAFAYATNDEINDMTFQRYKLINRAIESIDSMFFAMWVDPDLGCAFDDYVGCDTTRSLAYIYNQDILDGQAGCICAGTNTYCDEVPILGVDYFRGPLDEDGNEIGMSSFTYYNNGGGTPTPVPGTTDPNNALEYYRYLSGSWRDGSPFTFGGDAYQDGRPIKYAFTEAPNDTRGWSMCAQSLAPGDRRTIQASGPFRLDPGAVNELIIGAVWVPDQTYPCPSIARLQEADDVAQALFDNCFRLTDGPDAPDVDFIELDREIIAVFTNDTLLSNNAYEAYAQPGLRIPAGSADSLYRFEGYKLYQLANPNVTVADLNDPDKARLIYQVDVQNGVSKIYNWFPVENPTGQEYYAPRIMVDGANQGIRHTFRITEDQFAQDDRRLVNHKKYYFTAIAYAYNEYLPFDPKQNLGQRQPYLEGRRNIGDGTNIYYTTIPRPIVDRNLNAQYGDGAVVTRVDGVGNGGNFLDLSNETRAAVLDTAFKGEITYRSGRGPIRVNIFNPLDVKDGNFELAFFDENMSNTTLDKEVRWRLRNLDNPNGPVVVSENTIDKLNEQIIKEFGFTVTIGQVADVGTNTNDPSNGAIGYEEEYLRGENANEWLFGIPDDFIAAQRAFDELVFNYVATGDGQTDEVLDPNQALSKIGPGYFVPFYLSNFRSQNEQDPPFISPAWMNLGGSNVYRQRARLSDLNNVDIVFTSDKSKWSRCVVVETANKYYRALGSVTTQGNRDNFDLRAAPSVTTEDANNDGLPDVDTRDGGIGMAWFPGYAVDVETGQRLNIFFGENSTYDGSLSPEAYTSRPAGRDMMFNPASQILLNTGGFPNIYQYYAGGQHFVYVTRQPYDGCAQLRSQLGRTGAAKEQGIRQITWAGFILPAAGQQMRSYKDGLIPDDVIVKLRVNNPYAVSRGTGRNNGYPAYNFRIQGEQATDLDQAGVSSALDMINVVPNPYYGYSAYEISQFTNTVKITNLPAKCVVSIYSLDGRFIRRYTRDEQGIVPRGVNRAIERSQIVPDLEWDLRNAKGIPIASGVYLIHVQAEGLGERTIKWFGINRKFDPSGL